MALLGAMALSAGAAVPRQQESNDWTGAAVCANCHASQFEAWRGSHHDLAMQPLSDTTVLGNFDGGKFRHDGITSTFFRRDGDYWIETAGPDGTPGEYRVAYVFGVDPLQQYLVEFAGGRLQALDIAWDSRPAASGGQRWFRLAPGVELPNVATGDAALTQEAVPRADPDAPDPMHWTGTYYNWNSRCAECHSTNLSKAYDRASASYDTTWSEINVACEACHGPGAQHVALAREGRSHEAPEFGLEAPHGTAGVWRFVAGEKIARRESPAGKPLEVQNCARCHARRTRLDDDRPGSDFLDAHLPAMLEEGLYHVDGQIQEEVYVYGSFVQSRMYQAGVTCSNCHDPHSLALRAPGNAVCAQCHLPGAYDNATHHHHAAGSPGAACVNCHMPATTYMEIDPRRDHSFQVPRPDISAIAGTPNACNGCHENRSLDWTINALADWGVNPRDTHSHRGSVLHVARGGDSRAAPALQAIAMDNGMPGIWRATAAAELSRFPSQQVVDTAASLFRSDDALIRLGAARAIEFLPWRQRLTMLAPHLQDTSRSVRIEIARLLAQVPTEQLEADIAGPLERLFDEYAESLARNADMPEALAQQADFLTARRQWGPAEKAYLDALDSDPHYAPALLNLADLYRRLERDDDARAVLHRSIGLVPGQAAAHHALGLLETRAGNRESALRHLARAAELETNGVRYRYVHAIALHDGGEVSAAIEALKALLRAAPANGDVLIALVNYSRDIGRLEDARHYARKLRDLFPHDPAIRRLYESL